MKTFALLLGLGFVAFTWTATGQNAVDLTFDPGSGANSFIETTVVQPDDKVLVCGSFTAINGTPRRYVARLNPNGSLDPGFVADPNYWVRTMALQPDGKVVIGGFFTGVQGALRPRIARLNSDGSLDTTFNPGTGCTGRMVIADPTDPFVFAVAVQADGKIIIGGNFTNYNGTIRYGAARLHSDGSLDTSFNIGSGFNSWVRSILILPNNQIMLSGWFENYNNRSHNRVIRLNPDGSADTTFNPWFGYSTAVYTMARQSDGKIVVGGHSVNTNAPFRQEVVRLLNDGSFDPTFNAGGEGANDKVESVVIQPDGKIVIGGYFSLYNNTLRRGFARLHPDGSLDASLNVEVNNWIWTLSLQRDDKVLVCGAFSSINGVPRNAIARVNPSDDYVPPPPPPEPDTTAPTVNIVSPTEGARVSVSHISGTASDNIEVVHVLYRVGSGEFIEANGTTSWSAQPVLSVGTNTISVKSVDSSGNESEIITRTFVLESTNTVATPGTLALEILGPGTASLTNGQPLVDGKSYTIRAKPNGTNLFYGWSGSVTSSSPSLKFVMSTNMFLRAKFGPNPFASAAGSYNGLFSGTNGITHQSAGYISLTVRSSGAFSGTLLTAGARAPLSGKFDFDGNAQKTVSRKGGDSLDVVLLLDFAGLLSGTVNANGEMLSIDAERSRTASDLSRAKYTVLVPPGDNPANAPGGFGFGFVTVDQKGKVVFRGTLADGAVATQSAFVTSSSRWPFFVPLYRGSGLIAGWLTFTNEPTSDLSGDDIAWFKAPNTTTKFYTNGFVHTGTVRGALYVPPSKGASPFGWSSGQMESDHGNLDAPSLQGVAVAGGKLVINSTNRTALTLATATGALNGTFDHPKTGKRAQMKGVVFQKEQMGAGHFFGTSESGYFLLQPETAAEFLPQEIDE